MSQEIAILFSGYMAGVVFGSVMSVTLYKYILAKNGVLPRVSEPKQGQVAQ